MRNIDEVLREKTSAIEQVRRQVEALRLVAPLLAEATDSIGGTFLQPVMSEEAVGEMDWNLPQDAENVPAKEPAKARPSASDSRLTKARKISRELKRITAPLLGASGS
jgi:hypothetical protein